MLPFVRPSIPPPEGWAQHLAASYRSHYFSNFGPAEASLRALFETRFGAPDRRAVTFSNATAGITAALLACGISGAVVCPAFTFPATAQAILGAGLRPVFCDVDPATWELCPQALARLLPRVRPGAVLHVRAFGHCRTLAPVGAVCAAAGVPLIVDAAAAMGGRLSNGTPVGHEGMVEIFSLHATKPFGIGEGGMAFCPDHLAGELRAASNFGLGGSVASGLNAKMSEFHAAIGLAVAERFEGQLLHRRAIARRYRTELAGLPVELPDDAVGLPPWQTMPLLLAKELDTAEVLARMLAAGVTARRYYFPALHLVPALAHLEAGPMPVTESLSERALCLPIYGDMTEGEQDSVVQAFIGALS